MRGQNQDRRNERGVSMDDLDSFRDLIWERDEAEMARRREPRRQRPVNLSARIEEYIRTYL